MSNALISLETLSAIYVLPADQMKEKVKNCIGYYLGHYILSDGYGNILLWESCSYCGNKKLSQSGCCSTCGAPPSLI